MRKKARRSSPAKRFFGGVWYVLVLSFVFVGSVIVRWAGNSTLVSKLLNPFALLSAANPRKTFNKEHGLTILLLGTDETRVVTGWAREKNGQEHAISKPIDKSRADMILVARLDFDRHTISGLSVPRDTGVRLSDFDGKLHKINAFYSIAPKGEEKAMMVRAVEEVMPGVSIDRAVVINYAAFQDLVDTVGGVTVKVPKGRDGKGLNYDDWSGDLHVHLTPGSHLLNGKDAMGYVRFRHDRESDYGRQDRQKQFLASFKSSVFENLGKLPEIAEQGKLVLNNTLSDDEIIALAAFARSVPPTGIKMGMLPTREGGRHSNMLYVDESKRDDALREFGLVESRVAAVAE